ncbi:eukaryotic translation initiation factor 3 subunit K, putative [Hepatocystis sp. ex Piliocolobus tephrosceles]|nr:eukaryotic translation initiation factor 3 subunit K, putative [Hepatocystis sp. ex Piliocolobus tephrosceles]
MDIESIIQEVQAIKVYPYMMYNASKLKVLSDYVNIAFENNEYFDNDVMLILLRLFCLYPHSYDKDVIKKMLICVLYNINTVDMNTYLSLINPNLFDENVKSVIYLYELLKDCQFIKLWKCINQKNEDKNNSDYSFLINCDSFTNNIRKYILNSISLSYENITLKKMSEYLNMDMPQLESFLNENNWVIKKVNYKDQEQVICSNNNIEAFQTKNISNYFSEDYISLYIDKLNN